jgi:hypothetical protein
MLLVPEKRGAWCRGLQSRCGRGEHRPTRQKLGVLYRIEYDSIHLLSAHAWKALSLRLAGNSSLCASRRVGNRLNILQHIMRSRHSAASHCAARNPA